MNFLLDVNIIRGCGWKTHDVHGQASRSLERHRIVPSLYAPLAELNQINIENPRAARPGLHSSASTALRVATLLLICSNCRHQLS